MRVGLIVTCLVEQMFPVIGEATVELLRRLGHDVVVPRGQTCCGQPASTIGRPDDAKPVARRLARIMDAHADVNQWVVPSGSCADMIRHRYRDLGIVSDAPAKIRELSEFLIDTGVATVPGDSFTGRIAYHDSCHALRELGVADGPRRLLAAQPGVDVVELDPSRECCGFGGAFSVTFPSLSADMMATKLDRLLALTPAADALCAVDAGCLMHLAGGLRRRRHASPPRVLHLAQVLVGAPYDRSLAD